MSNTFAGVVVRRSQCVGIVLAMLLAMIRVVSAQDDVLPVVPLPKEVVYSGQSLSIADVTSEALAASVTTSHAAGDDRIGAEGYVLEISANGIQIGANTDQGEFYARQTLKQLVRGFQARGEIPGMRIVDWPDMPFRAISDDNDLPGPIWRRSSVG